LRWRDYTDESRKAAKNSIKPNHHAPDCLAASSGPARHLAGTARDSAGGSIVVLRPENLDVMDASPRTVYFDRTGGAADPAHLAIHPISTHRSLPIRTRSNQTGDGKT
jgi:hypothetical protein